MDINITVQDELDDKNDAENIIMSENDDIRRSERDSKSCTPNNI